jgi:hypothetical protein
MSATEMEEEISSDGAANPLPETGILRQEMRELFIDYNRHISVLFERMNVKLQMIGAQLADISQRLPPRQ